MKVGVFLNYIGLGANLLHLSYCHEIAKIYGPITLISLSKNLDQALEDDELIHEVKIFEKNKNVIDIPKFSSSLRSLNLDCIYIFYPSARIYLAAKLAGIKTLGVRNQKEYIDKNDHSKGTRDYRHPKWNKEQKYLRWGVTSKGAKVLGILHWSGSQKGGTHKLDWKLMTKPDPESGV